MVTIRYNDAVSSVSKMGLALYCGFVLWLDLKRFPESGKICIDSSIIIEKLRCSFMRIMSDIFGYTFTYSINSSFASP